MTYTAPDYPTTTTVNYASWIQRVGAYVIDALIVAVPSWIGSGINIAMMTDGKPSSGGTIISLIFSLVGLALLVYNRWVQGGRTGQSWGKKVLGIRLVGEQTGQPIGVAMAFVRDLCHIVDALICYVGFLFPLWDAKRQTLADKIVKTLVVSA
jgi:uncharacterized RDD family membrane protein YckC